jgi:serine/threonine protein kinase
LRKEDVGWIETGEAVAIKAVSFRCIRANRNRLSEDFYKEAAALNYISNGLRGSPIEETHVLTADTVMCTNSHLFMVMPYCDGGDLFDRVAHAERTRLTEDEARFYFEQILTVSLVEGTTMFYRPNDA